MTPTRRQDWVKAGDDATLDGAMVGRVERIVKTRSVPYAVVSWPSGSTGRHSVTTLRRVHPTNGYLRP